MSRISSSLVYLALFPGLGFFYLGLMLIGQVNVGPFELENLRPFGGPSLSNVVEIPVVALAGGVAAIVLGVRRRRGGLGSIRLIVRYMLGVFGGAILFYFLMPTLPE